MNFISFYSCVQNSIEISFLVIFFIFKFVKFSVKDPNTAKRGGYDRTIFITDDDLEKKVKAKDNDLVISRHFEKSDSNTKL